MFFECISLCLVWRINLGLEIAVSFRVNKIPRVHLGPFAGTSFSALSAQDSKALGSSIAQDSE